MSDDAGWALLSGFDITGTDGSPYLDRLCILRTPLASLYLHHIHQADSDPDPHDHPWSFASLVLSGGYRETVWPDKMNCRRSASRSRRRFSVARTGRESCHMITSVEGRAWTLVLTGTNHGGWGFWVRGRLVPWRDYLEPGRGSG